MNVFNQYQSVVVKEECEARNTRFSSVKVFILCIHRYGAQRDQDLNISYHKLTPFKCSMNLYHYLKLQMEFL